MEYRLDHWKEVGHPMKENELTKSIIGCAIEVHKELGPGLVESVYEEALCYELSQAGLKFKRQQQVPILPSYLRLRRVHLGLLINFNVLRLVDGVHRVINGFSTEAD